MHAEQLDGLIGQWLSMRSIYHASSYHVQVKLPSDEVAVARLTENNPAGWVVIDWQHRGRGLSAKKAIATTQAPVIAHLLNGIPTEHLHAHFQLVVAPEADWKDSYSEDSLTPDLLPVLDAGRAEVLSVTAEREYGDWHVILAHQPPSDEPLVDFTEIA